MDIREHRAIIPIVLYYIIYGLILWTAYTAFIPDEILMKDFIRRINAYKDMTYMGYCLTNCIIALNCRSQLEKEILLTGILSVTFITVLNTLHKTSILIMSSQLTLLLFIGTFLAVLLMIYYEGRKHGLFKDNA